jgi:ABC-type Fe3+/spermidine/putrescine transport system ATPase subunit
MSVQGKGGSIVFDNVEKRFGSVRALHPFNLEVRAGEFLTLLGPSGSGKTTLLNIASGYLDADAGRVLLGGRDVTKVSPRHRNIGMVFQNYALFPHLSVFENIAYGLRVRRRPAREISERVDATLRMVRLDGYEGRAIQQLSGGQQQRVALARAMVIEPDLLLMDEPLGALDRQLRKHVQLEIRQLHNETPRTTIYVTHDQEEALVMSDRIAIMSDGRLEQIGTPQELYARPRNAFVATFLGESNLIPVTLTGADAGHVSFVVDGMGGEWSIPHHEGIPTSGSALLLVRPEAFSPAGESEPSLPATVEEVVYLGELTALRLSLATGQKIWMRQITSPITRAAGQPARIRWNPELIRLLETDHMNSTGRPDHDFTS